MIATLSFQNPKRAVTRMVLSASGPSATVTCRLTINGVAHTIGVDSRITLLDVLREYLHLTGMPAMVKRI
jgi:hypothetical protein